MDQSTAEKIQQNETFQKLVATRSAYNWKMAIIMMTVYFAFILFIAFNPAALGTKISEGSVMSIGIVTGFLVIIFAFVLTGIYVRRANSEFDAMNNEIKEAHK